MSTYQRVKDVLADGEWHSIEELKAVSMFPERWVEELRRDGIEIVEDQDEGKIALVAAAASAIASIALRAGGYRLTSEWHTFIASAS